MAKKGIPLKSRIRQYILDIGGKITEEPRDPNFELIFQFEYGNRGFSVSKPKKRKELGITHGFHLNDNHKQILEQLMTKKESFKKFVIGFTNILHYFKMEYNFNFQENRILIFTKIFIKNSSVTTNKFYDKFMGLFGCNKVLLNFIHNKLEGGDSDFEISTNGTPPSGFYS